MPTTIAEARTQFRELVNEKNTTILSDTEVDGYIQAGLEALNRRARYHYKTTTDSLTLVNGTQEYALPTDLVELKWVEWDGVELTKASVEQWRVKNKKWRQIQKGALDEWAMYGNQIVFSPAPSAEVVTKASIVTLRFVSRPASFSASGMAQLNLQDWDIPIYYAIYLWSTSYPDSALAQQRADRYYKLFEQETEAVLAYYRLRGTEK